MKRNLFSAVLLLSTLTGCSALKVSGLPGADPEPEPAKNASPPASEPASTPSSSDGSASSAKTPTTPEPKVSKGEEDSESSFMGERSKLGEIERMGEVFVSEAIDGFSADDLKKIIKSRYDKHGEQPSPAILERADKVKQAQKDAAAVAAKKWGEKVKPTVAASKDAAAEKAITEDFLKWHAGAEIKKVVLTDADWKQNYDGLVVRNRYKNAEVLIAVKGESFCLAVPANVAQGSTGTGFEKAYKHDVFNKGRAVPCN